MDWTNSIRILLGLALAGATIATFGWNAPLAGESRAWLIATGSVACSLSGLCLWWRALSMRTAMAGIPTARLASAPQGYVELHGRARRLTEEFSTVRPHYLWQRITRSPATPWWIHLLPGHATKSTEVTEVPFCFSDGEVSAVILPQGAEVICRNRQVEDRGGDRILTESILSGEPLYVLGYLGTLGDVREIGAEAERIAGDIRLDPVERRRYDLDGDGHFSIKELLKLHESAKKMALAQSVGRETHVIACPPDGRQYLISTLPPGPMSARFLGYAWLGFIIGLGGAASAVVWALWSARF